MLNYAIILIALAIVGHLAFSKRMSKSVGWKAMVTPLASIMGSGFLISAAVADDSGAGGLMEDLTNKKLPVKYAYLIILVITLTLTWETDVDQIIAYASRAFALYYAFQCMVAFVITRQNIQIGNRSIKTVAFTLLGILCLLVFALGIPSG